MVHVRKTVCVIVGHVGEQNNKILYKYMLFCPTLQTCLAGSANILWNKKIHHAGIYKEIEIRNALRYFVDYKISVVP
jgi:hypothetical protein